jgi:DNA-binding CsgD family transcriptional regulator
MLQSLRVKEGRRYPGNHGGRGKSGPFAWQSFCTNAPVHLSPRETEILRYIAAGHTTKELAAALNIAESTAEWHISNILVELGAASRAEAVAIGLREGLLEPEKRVPESSPSDLAIRRAHRARASRDDRVIHFDLLGLHLGEIRIGRARRDLAEMETKAIDADSVEPGHDEQREKGEQ